jgi:hypothetical protein
VAQDEKSIVSIGIVYLWEKNFGTYFLVSGDVIIGIRAFTIRQHFSSECRSENGVLLGVPDALRKIRNNGPRRFIYSACAKSYGGPGAIIGFINSLNFEVRRH